MHEKLLGKYITLQEFCTCTHVVQKHADRVNPCRQNLEETIAALEAPQIALVLSVIFGLLGWRAVATACAVARITS
jgi:hypothetical protein